MSGEFCTVGSLDYFNISFLEAGGEQLEISYLNSMFLEYAVVIVNSGFPLLLHGKCGGGSKSCGRRNNRDPWSCRKRFPGRAFGPWFSQWRFGSMLRIFSHTQI